MWLNELWRRWIGRTPRRIRRQLRHVPARTLPTLERLQDRTLLSPVITTPTGLVAAINSANAAGGSTTLTLAAQTTFNFTTASNSTNGANALPVIKANLTIIGNGDTIERTGSNAFRLFDVSGSGSLTLQNMTLQGGLAQGLSAAADGGAVYSSGILSVNAVTVQSN